MTNFKAKAILFKINTLLNYFFIPINQIEYLSNFKLFYLKCQSISFCRFPVMHAYNTVIYVYKLSL